MVAVIANKNCLTIPSKPESQFMTKLEKSARNNHMEEKKITWKGKPLSFVPTAKYRGIRLQTLGTRFTEDVEAVCC